MAVITQTNGVLDAIAPANVTRTVLSASDTLTFVRGSKQALFLFNTTASPVTVTLTGTAPATLAPDGYGGTIATTGGKAIVVPASGSTFVQLDDMWAFLAGTGVVTCSGGVGITAHLYV